MKLFLKDYSDKYVATFPRDTDPKGPHFHDPISRRKFLRSLTVPAALAIMPSGLLQMALQAETPKSLSASSIRCVGKYPGHLQGVCTNNVDGIYWVFTTMLVKTDVNGTILNQIPVARHHGAPCYLEGKIYVPVNLGGFNLDANKLADSWIYVYDANDLSFISKHKADEVIYGAGGMACHKDKFLVVGGLPIGFNENYVYEYDRNLNFVRKIILRSGYTYEGIQTAAYNDGYWWFGCYGFPRILLKVDEYFNSIQRFSFDCSLGILPLDKKTFLVAGGNTHCSRDGGCTGRLFPVVVDVEKGLVQVDSDAPAH